MVAKAEQCHLDTGLILRDRSLSSLTVHAVALTLTKQDDKVIECRLTFQVNPELYQRINTEALFNLKPEVREPFAAGDFQSEPDIKIEASLKPDLLTHLTERAADVNEAATYILSLNQEQPDNPLLSTENWFGLSVRQATESGETGYRTFWAYVNPSVFAQAASSSKEISKAIIDFFKKWAEAHLPAATQEATSEILEGVTNFFKELADISLDGLSQEVEAGFKPIAKGGKIFEEIVNFFKEDNWPFVQIEGKPVLQMAFQGENGKWTCNASARVEQEQFLFYSICPVNAPENKRLAIAEFLTRANSGMSIGNFELDFADGEIRYKTSIDVEGDRLSSASIKKLVYTNVIMMDQYLPGIMSVIYGDVSPGDAIAQIES